MGLIGIAKTFTTKIADGDRDGLIGLGEEKRRKEEGDKSSHGFLGKRMGERKRREVVWARISFG